MASSPSHKFGQIIGDVLELAIEPTLRRFAKVKSLFLDKKGKRPARKGNKVSWTDLYGNTHDLDFVLERHGSPEKIGDPVAFIETAWRRYTKHSRNKAQEIQGAILPLHAAHKNLAPFIGVVLAGDFTEGALNQLRSLGFNVLYFPYESVIQAFSVVGINASFDEETPDAHFKKKVRSWYALSALRRHSVGKKLLISKPQEVAAFVLALSNSVSRYITRVYVLPLHGRSSDMPTVAAAISFIERYVENDTHRQLIRYEVQIQYNNGDRIDGQFRDKQSTIDFLKNYLKPSPA